jgi:hypothetical protein
LGFGVLGALDPTRSTNRHSQSALILFFPLLAATAVPFPLAPSAALLLLLSLLLAEIAEWGHGVIEI